MIESVGTAGLWAGFVGLVLVLLALDLGVFHRRDRAIGAREALAWTAVWITLALVFGGLVWWRFGPGHGLDYLTGYLVEKSLSVDNLFVFVVIFGALAIPPALQHRVLYWGILTALVLRAAMIFVGAALLSRFAWLMLVFGGFLAVTGVRLWFRREEERHPERGRLFRLLRRAVPSTDRLEGHRFFVRAGGRWLATPLFLALALIEFSDVVFALDSIPAIFGITLDPFIVFTSNVFAILGLRSIYFALASLMLRFEHLEKGLSAVLVFIGAKMVLSPWVHVRSFVSLLVVVALLGGSVVFSAFKTRRAKPAPRASGLRPRAPAETPTIRPDV